MNHINLSSISKKQCARKSKKTSLAETEWVPRTLTWSNKPSIKDHCSNGPMAALGQPSESKLACDALVITIWKWLGQTETQTIHTGRGVRSCVRSDELEGAWFTARELNGFSWWALEPCSSESIMPPSSAGYLCKRRPGRGGGGWGRGAPCGFAFPWEWTRASPVKYFHMGTQKNDVRCGPGSEVPSLGISPRGHGPFPGCSFHDNRA